MFQLLRFMSVPRLFSFNKPCQSVHQRRLSQVAASGKSLFLDDLLKRDFLALICSLIKFMTAPGQNAVWDFYSKPSGFKLSIKYLLVDWASGKILFLDDITNG